MIWLRLLFDPSGRMGRRVYGLGILGLYAGWWGMPLAWILPAAILKDPHIQPPDSLLPWMSFVQFLVLPYVGVCLHLKRLRDAGRGPWTLMTMVALTLAAFPAAIALGLWMLRGQSGYENLNYPITIGILMILAAVIIFLAWPFYALWVGLGSPKPLPRQDGPDLAIAFE